MRLVAVPEGEEDNNTPDEVLVEEAPVEVEAPQPPQPDELWEKILSVLDQEEQ